MQRLVTITESGPRFHEPRSLADQLRASVDYVSEKQRQEELAGCVDSDSLPSEYALDITHLELEKILTRG